ncbi:rabphilin-3A-like [Prinia subflava]|uniref:rabphilin-3A-like n=1 Tax=Prinia subflava TaxID=208062 RepID=UPI002FE250BF
MRRCRVAGLAALAAVLLVASGRAQVQQEAFVETTEGSGISINCSHPTKQLGYYIHFYRQLPGRGPEFLALAARGSKAVPDIAGELRVSEDGRSSALWLRRPRRGDAAVYYCALGARAEEPGLRPGTNRRGSFLCPEPARTEPAQPGTPGARTRCQPAPARTHSPRTARHGLAPEPPSARHPTAEPRASASASRPPPAPAAARSRLRKANSCSCRAPAAPADKQQH